VGEAEHAIAIFRLALTNDCWQFPLLPPAPASRACAKNTAGDVFAFGKFPRRLDDLSNRLIPPIERQIKQTASGS